MGARIKKLRILLADDHAVVREGLKTLIHGEPDMRVIGEAEDGRSAIKLVCELKPHVVVMDVSMPNLNGVAATEQLKKMAPKVKVLTLTVHEERSYLEKLLVAGAAGYVLKRAARNELINAIRVVARGGTYIDPHVAGRMVESLVEKQSPQPSPKPQVLTERELAVARLIAQGYTNKEIAGQLELSTKTIETHKANFMGKLGLHSRAELVRYACEQGWLPGR